jgi:phosphoadenosine phosphosulfate reductase
MDHPLNSEPGAPSGCRYDAHDRAHELDVAFRPLSPTARLALLRNRIDGSLVFTTSFGLEDQVLTHWVAESGVDVRFVTLDTGRLFPETYDVWAATERRYGVRVRAFHPDGVSLEALVEAQGINGFRTSKPARLGCCAVRKVAPLGRALCDAGAWITGLRADQSASRSGMDFVSYDEVRNLIKANPLLDWRRDALVAFAEAEGVPLSPLHARGFLSIGCAPCTRAVRQGEDERAGRWWWENASAKECGLHLAADGRLVRSGAVP